MEIKIMKMDDGYELFVNSALVKKGKALARVRKMANGLWGCFLEAGRSVFILEDSYFPINDRNVLSLCLAECSDYGLYGLVHDIETDSDQGE